MGMKRRWPNHHVAAGGRTARWKALRLQALRRDGFACVGCGARGRLEVDHKIPARERPDLFFDLANLQTLCTPCHTRKTRIEAGHPELSPARRAWRDAVAALASTPKLGVPNA